MADFNDPKFWEFFNKHLCVSASPWDEPLQWDGADGWYKQDGTPVSGPALIGYCAKKWDEMHPEDKE